MTDTKAKKTIKPFNPQYQDDHITTDPHKWDCELTLHHDTLGGWVKAKTINGRGATKGEARQDARVAAAAYATRHLRA